MICFYSVLKSNYFEIDNLLLLEREDKTVGKNMTKAIFYGQKQ